MKKLKFLVLAFISLFCIGISNVSAIPMVSQPYGLSWVGTKACWSSSNMPGITVSGFHVVLSNGTTNVYDETITTTEKDFSSYLTDSTKTYTFSVTAISGTDGYDNSQMATSEAYYFSDFDVNDYPKLKAAVANGIAVNSVTPTIADTQWLLSIVAEDLLDQDGNYFAYAMATDTINHMELTVQDNSGDMPVVVYQTTINVTYVNPMGRIVTLGESLADKMNAGSQSYTINDLYAVNFYASAKSTTRNGSPLYSNIIKFSKELIDLTEGKNVRFRLPAGAGEDSPLFNSRMGEAIMYYDGYALNPIHATVTAKNILYVPAGTDNYLVAAQARLDKYLGAGKVTVTLYKSVANFTAELADEVNYDTEEESLGYAEYVMGEVTDGLTYDENVYNFKINNVDYKFLIAETDEDLEEPTYLGTNFEGTAKVTSDSGNVPLDSLLSVEEVSTDKYKKSINSKMYGAYDVSLYSDSKEANITKLDDGSFKVSIKVDSSLNGKTIMAYYKTSEGKLEEHPAKVENGYATFTTTHFSEYVLADSMATNPATGDNIITYVVIGLLSLIGLSLLYLKKKKYN